jgi:hypothetical protein
MANLKYGDKKQENLLVKPDVVRLSVPLLCGEGRTGVHFSGGNTS